MNVYHYRRGERKNRHFLFLILLLFLTAGVINADGVKVRIKADGASLRLRPDVTSPVVGQALPGTVLEAEETSGDWYRITLPPDENGFKITGYVQKNLVEIVSEGENIPEKKKEDLGGAVRRPEPQEETAPRPSRPRKFRLKGIIGLGIGFDRIPTGIYKKSFVSDDWTEVELMPGGGIHAEADIGYQIFPGLAIELGIGYQSTGTGVKDTKEEVTFKRYPLTLTLIHDFKSRGSVHVYIGGGVGYYSSPRIYVKVSSVELEITYKPSLGFHGLLGLSWKSNDLPIFFFGEIRFAGVMNYTWEKASANGYEAIPSATYEKLTGKGIYLNFGVGYSF